MSDVHSYELKALRVTHPVTCGRSLQQTTVRDATQHGNTHFKGGGGGVHGEGGVMRFFFFFFAKAANFNSRVWW